MDLPQNRNHQKQWVRSRKRKNICQLLFYLYIFSLRRRPRHIRQGDISGLSAACHLLPPSLLVLCCQSCPGKSTPLIYNSCVGMVYSEGYCLSYRVSHNWVLTLFCLFSQLHMLIQRFILPFFNSPGDDDSKTHLPFLPTSKIYQVTEQNVRQTGFRYYYFGT